MAAIFIVLLPVKMLVCFSQIVDWTNILNTQLKDWHLKYKFSSFYHIFATYIKAIPFFLMIFR